MAIAHMFGVALIALLWITNSEGHGYLQKPAQRSSLWRFEKSNRTHYTDNQLNCGGASRQWNTNGGKCGLCGDPYDGERQNEAGGYYAIGVIAENYVAGDVIEAEVMITANHKGYFEFRLCAHDDWRTNITQECLDENLLEVVESDNSGTTRHNITYNNGIHKAKLQLPAEVTCTYCVLQWKYVAGNNWGSSNQETFINCADIAIRLPASGTKSSSKATVSATMSVLSSSTSAQPVTSKSTAAATTTTKTTYDHTTTTISVPTTATTTSVPTTTTTTTIPTTTTTTTTTTASGVTETGPKCIGQSIKQCTVTDTWKNYVGMSQWCVNNCRRGYCPPSHCKKCTC